MPLLLNFLLAAFLAPAAAQTWTNCNPMNRSDCPDDLALGTTYNFDFNQTLIPSIWNTTSGMVKAGPNGGEFTIKKRYDSPTVQSTFYIFFGRVEVHMQAASGQGIISSIVLESDDLDEIDWEFMGGNTTHVETNYFGKGNTTSYDRAIYYPANKPLETFHNYTVHWTSTAIEWWIDGILVRTLPYAAANGGNNFPQTPMNVRLGIWAGGDPSNKNGTIEWAGGITDFTKGPYTMYVRNVSVSDFSTGKEYHYSDKSGRFQSVKITSGSSSVASTLSNPAAVSSAMASASAAQASSVASGSAGESTAAPSGFISLPSGVKTGIYSAAGACGAALLGFLIFFCIKQRRVGRSEQAAYNAKLEKERLDECSDTMELKHHDSFSALAPTPEEYEESSTSSGYNRASATGFGSGNSYEAPVPPIPSVPPPYSGGSRASPRNISGSASDPSSGLVSPVSPRTVSSANGGTNFPFPAAQTQGGYQNLGRSNSNFSMSSAGYGNSNANGGTNFPFPSAQTQGGYQNLGRSNTSISASSAGYGNSGFNGNGAAYVGSNGGSSWNNANPSSPSPYGNGYARYQNRF